MQDIVTTEGLRMTKDFAGRRTIGRGAAAFALAMLLAAPLGAMAQQASPAAPATPAPEAMPAPPPAAPSEAAPKPGIRHRRAARKPTSRVETHIARLHAELKITPAQTTEWNAVAEIMRSQAREMEKLERERAAGRATMTAVDDLKSYQAIAVAHAEEMSKLVPAFQALYARMSPEQQKNADVVFRGRPHKRGRKPRHKIPSK